MNRDARRSQRRPLSWTLPYTVVATVIPDVYIAVITRNQLIVIRSRSPGSMKVTAKSQSSRFSSVAFFHALEIVLSATPIVARPCWIQHARRKWRQRCTGCSRQRRGCDCIVNRVAYSNGCCARCSYTSGVGEAPDNCRSNQPFWIRVTQRIADHVAVRIDASPQPNRITLHISSIG